jgi:hypothetical protein
MKVQVNVDSLSPTLEGLIKQKLESQGLPGCLGNMTPPIIESFVDMDFDEVFKKRDSVPEENIVLTDLSHLVSDIRWQSLVGGRILDKNGEIAIKQHKEFLSTEYVMLIALCVNFSHKSLCDRLTYHYLTTIALKKDQRR